MVLAVLTRSPMTAPRTAGRSLRTIVRIAFVVAAAALLVWAVYREREDFGAAVGSLAPATVVGALALVFVALGFNLLAWREAMSAVGIDAPFASSARVFFLSQLGKYVPGSVWSIVAQIELTRDAGVSRLRGVVGATVALVVGVVTSSVLACGLLVLPDPQVRSRYGWVLLVVPFAATALQPSVLRRLITLVLRMTGRSGTVPPLSGRALLRSIAWSAGMWCLLGAHAWLIADGLAPARPASVVIVTGAFALAWVVGFLVVIAPAGIGVREAALVLALSSVLDTPDALALALVSRVLMTVADGVAAALASASYGRERLRADRQSSLE